MYSIVDFTFILSQVVITVKDECDIGMYSRLRSFCTLYGWRPRNSGYTAEFQLWSMSVSPLISTSNPRPTRSGGKRVAETRNWISQARIINLKNESGKSNFEFRQLVFHRIWSGGDSRWRWEGRRTWITAGIPLYIQNSVAFSRIRSKNSVNGCTCQYHIHLLLYK